jgi:hypothetical protein
MAVTGGNPIAVEKLQGTLTKADVGGDLTVDLAQDQYETIKAVGAEGNALPLSPFVEYLAP